MRRNGWLQAGNALSQFLNTLLGGWSDESTSSRAWRMHTRSKRWARMRRFIDGLRANTFVLRNPIPALPEAAPAELRLELGHAENRLRL